jgi:hypothetical protein
MTIKGLEKLSGQFDTDTARNTKEFEEAANDAILRESARIEELEKLVGELTTTLFAVKAKVDLHIP